MPLALAIRLPTALETESLGAALGRTLPEVPESAVLHLVGDLGAGKTTCVRSLLRSLGITRPVRSPTYTLVETYSAGPRICVHVDLYRLHGATEVDELGLAEMAGPSTLFLIEWPEKGGIAVPRPDLVLRLTHESDARSADIKSMSIGGMSWLEKLARDASLRPYVTNIT